MKNMKHILSGVIAAVVVAGSASLIGAADITFTDRFNADGTLHWAWQRGFIPYLVEKDVLNGYTQDDGTSIFKPEATVTRAEFIKMLDETFGLTETADIRTKYTDVTEGNWFYTYFAKAVAQGYILNYGSTANPDGELSREEATSLVVRYLNLSDDEKAASATFTDYDKINALYRDDVMKAVKDGFIEGYKLDDGTSIFQPQKTLTRAEALTILYRAAGAIYTENTAVSESAAYEKNAIIKTGNIKLSNQNLKGRVIIGEGADNGTVEFASSALNDVLYIRGDANIVLDGTTAKTVVVDSKGIVNITVRNGSTVDHLIINEQTNVLLGAGTTINKLTTTDGAAFTTVSGSGVIKSAEISSSDFSAAMVPTEYEIAKGITAVFASKSYKGSSAAQNAFASNPVVSVEGSYHCLTLTATAAGEVRFYFTNNAECPDADEFDLYYSAAAAKDDFTVKANKAEAKLTQKYETVKKYSYVVLQLAADGIDYQPVLVSNEIAEGTGFTKDPYLKSQTKIEYTTQASGTVYYMYAEKGDEMTAEKFLTAYAEQSKELKGESTLTSDVITINSRYADVNRYMVFMFKSASGLCYTPVVVPMGQTGFAFEPKLYDDGTISGVTDVSGVLYVYYAESEDLPSTSKYNTYWKNADYSEYASVLSGREFTLELPDNLPAKYTYAIISVRESGGDYQMPIALRIELDHGFTVLPSISDEEEILFKAAVDGTVYYYYSDSDAVPDAEAFDEEYISIASSYRSKLVVDGGLNTTLVYSDTKAAAYPYLVLMLEADDGTCYHPVVVDLNEASDTGFTTAPYVFNSSTVYYKTDYDCQIWWYYARFDTAVSADKFAVKWEQSPNGSSAKANANVRGTITYDSELAEDYPYLVIATSKTRNTDIYTTPIIIKLNTSSTSTVEDTGFEVINITEDSLFVNTTKAGIIYYYETDESKIPALSEFDDKYYACAKAYRHTAVVSANKKNVELPITGLQKYIILQLEGKTEEGTVYYDIVRVNTQTGGNNSSGTTTVNKYGFDLVNVVPRDCKVMITPQYSGVLTVSITDNDKLDPWVLTTSTYNVTKDEVFTITYPTINSTLAGTTQLYITLELKSTDGITFSEKAIELIPAN